MADVEIVISLEREFRPALQQRQCSFRTMLIKLRSVDEYEWLERRWKQKRTKH
jgi:hypothetical protein